jgi:pimeloyl-ACP methyl ester carboxylesterase
MRQPSNASSGRTIVLIHGLWLNALSWERWVARYESRGHRVIARSWPGMDREVEALRRDTSAIERLGVAEVAEHYEGIIRGLETPPIIMGHSFGGAITQILLDRGLGAAGVAIDSAPVRGVLALPWTSIRSAFPALKNPANVRRAVMLTADESARVYERYAVPGPGRPLFQAALANFNPRAATRVDFRNDARAPLLFVAGSADRVTPPVVNRENAKLQRRSKAITAYREFPARSHYTVGQEGWEEVADFALSWALEPTRLD